MIKSNECVLTFALDGENYFPVYCGTGFALTVNTEIIETTTKGDGQYQDFDYNSLSYSLTIDGLGKLDTYSTFDVLYAQRTFMDLPFRLIFQEGDSVQVIEGTVMVLSTDLTVTADEHMNYSHEFRGRGPYEIRNTIEPCPSVVLAENVIVTTNPFTGAVQVEITSSSGAVSFNWSIDGGPPNNAAGTTFLAGSYDAGDHSITVTPVCANGEEGTGATKSFTIS